MSRPAPPLYYRTAPETWFKQLEAYFNLHKVDPNEFYSFCVSLLPEDIAVRVIDPTNADYDALKKRLESEHATTLHERVQDALTNIPLDGRKPSSLVADIRQKFTNAKLTASDNIIKSRLLAALPSSAQPILISHMEKSLDDFAEIADAVFSTLSSNHLSALNTRIFNDYNRNNKFNTPDDNRNSFQYRSNLNNKFRQTQRYSEPFHNRNFKICGYHCRFGKQSRSCTSWCEWPNKSNIQINQRNPREHSLGYSRDQSRERFRPRNKLPHKQGNPRTLSR